MRCFICNKILEPDEVRYNQKYEDSRTGPYDPCGKCLTAISEIFDDHDEEIIEENPYDTEELDTTLMEVDDEIEDSYSYN